MNPSSKVLKESFPVVCQVLPALEPGGMEQVALELVRYRCDVAGPERNVVFCTDSPGAWYHRLTVPAACGYRRIGAWGFDVRLVMRLVRFIRVNRVDVLHAHNARAGLYAGLAGRITGCRVVVTFHGEGVVSGHPTRFLLRIISRLADRVAVVSHRVGKRLEAQGLVPAGKIRVVLNGVDTRVFRPADNPVAIRAAVRSEPGFTAEHLLLGTAGRLSPEKDQAMLIRAVGRMVRVVDVTVCLMIAGEGSCRALLEQVVGSEGLGLVVRFCGQRDDMADWYRALDGFVMTSRTEGLP
ncbi:MAG: hypothetical protein A2498_13770, partial [Lentisphaerae bacterium RIFOXYC12_FULL_60_16]